MSKQLSFTLPSRSSHGRADFVIAPSNAMALHMIDDWKSWPGQKMVLSGPVGAGKTHLAHLWAESSGARVVPAAKLADCELTLFATRAVAVEDIDTILRDGAAQRALFHLYNLLSENAHPLLMTGKMGEAGWDFSLADLKSRVESAAQSEIYAPDDMLLGAVLNKLFSDRQILPSPNVIPFLLSRMERSFAYAEKIVAALDADSLERKAPITRARASIILDKLQPDET